MFPLILKTDLKNKLENQIKGGKAIIYILLTMKNGYI